ncbi:MAG: dihydrolipoamide acetyltransferase family protein [Kiloniellales bacterium]
MGEHVIKLPDVGEGVAEAEIVEWHVAPGDLVREDDVLAAVMTDKATVEIPSPVTGKVLWLACEIGEIMAVGAPLIRLEVTGEGTPDVAEEAPAPDPVAEAPEAPPGDAEPAPKPAPKPTGAPVATRFVSSVRPVRAEGEKPLAAPSVRKRARDNGVDLRRVAGSGPAGRITHEDLDAFFRQDPQPAASGLQPDTSVTETRVVGLRRKIAAKMSLSSSRIPHITIVEEVDMTALEELRATMNTGRREHQPKLTILPFLMRALVRALADQPGLNAHYDDEAQVIHQFGGVHIGMAAQTPGGLVVPVIKHAEARDVWACGAEVNRLADAAKSGTATRDELSGSTITITSLGPLGALATTPIINHPEVAIIGVNRMQMRPVWDGRDFVPRKMMNLSSSFDHRVVDGWDAAVFVNRIKTLLETPALIFMEADK